MSKLLDEEDEKQPEYTPVVPNQELLDDPEVPTITIGFGAKAVKWPIRRMSVRQNRRIIPLLAEVLPPLMEAQKKGEMSGFIRSGTDDRLYKIIFIALRRGHPDLSEAQFEDFELGVAESFDAITTIGLQTGLYSKVDIGAKRKSGELPGGEQAVEAAPQTGIKS